MLIWLLHGEYTSLSRYSFNIATLAIWCGLGVFWFCPAITIYTGLSAVLHGVIIWGAIKDITVGLKSGYVLFMIDRLGRQPLLDAFLGLHFGKFPTTWQASESRHPQFHRAFQENQSQL